MNQSTESAEPDGDVEYRSDGRSAVSLRVAAAAAPVRLGEHEVLSGHHSRRRIQRQRRADVVTEVEGGRRQVGGRRTLGEVGKQRLVAVRVRIAVDERQILTVYLPTKRTTHMVVSSVLLVS